MKPPICKKIIAVIPGSGTFNLIPHLLRLEPSFGRSSVTHKPTNPQTDSRIIYNRWLTYYVVSCLIKERGAQYHVKFKNSYWKNMLRNVRAEMWFRIIWSKLEQNVTEWDKQLISLQICWHYIFACRHKFEKKMVPRFVPFCVKQATKLN